MEITEPAVANQSVLNADESAVLKTLLYFDCFRYPLNPSEIYRFSQGSFKIDQDCEKALESLLKKEFIFLHKGFYQLRNEPASVERRIKGNLKAQEMMPKAMSYGHKISKFPFVKAVCISGSLSKGYADNKSDVDFFIITSKNRLWICRSLLIAYKKVFLLNSRKYFCVNYFVAEDNLTVPDKNMFTATEIATLLPVNSDKVIFDFIQANSWIKNYLPNSDSGSLTVPPSCLKPAYVKFIEKMFTGELGNKTDQFFLKLTLSKWKRKFSQFNTAEFELNMRSKKNVSKQHPSGFQAKVMNAFNENILRFELEHHTKLN